MKARVKATGDIIENSEACSYDEPDYWEKLKHQYAGMAMQGMFANPAFKDVNIKFVVLGAVGAAAELINKLKEEEK